MNIPYTFFIPTDVSYKTFRVETSIYGYDMKCRPCLIRVPTRTKANMADFLRRGRFFCFRRSTVTLLLMVLAVGPTVAQTEVQTRKFTLAETYLRAGQYDRAIALLEDLYVDAPTTFVFYDKLKQAYVAVKRYDDAVRLIEARMTTEPTPALRAEKGGLLYQKGQEDEAFATWDEAVAMDPAQAYTYQSVYYVLSNLRLYDRAIAVLEQGRQRLQDDQLFQTDLAYLYGIVGEHAKAMTEYIGLVELNPDQLGFVKRRFSRFSEQPDAVSSSLPVVERAIRREPLNRAFRELAAWLYMEAGLMSRALDANRAIDRLEKEEGRVLLQFARQATQADAFDEALSAYEEVLNRYPDAPTAASSQFALARLYMRQAETGREAAYDDRGNRIPAPYYDAALGAYQTFVQSYPNDARVPEAIWQMGRLNLLVYNDLGAAESILTEVTTRYVNTEYAPFARFDLGMLALMRDDLHKARLILGELEEDLRLGELAERARYEIARIDFYEGHFESARALVNALDENTGTDIANDAIELKVLLQENKGPDSLDTPLRLYARAERLERQRRPTEALALLDSLVVTFTQHKLVDEAGFRRGLLLRTLGRHTEAMTALTALMAAHPESYLADLSLFTLAEIQETDLQDPTAALETYTRLLTVYPGSLLAPEVRTRIRRLRNDGA